MKASLIAFLYLIQFGGCEPVARGVSCPLHGETLVGCRLARRIEQAP